MHATSHPHRRRAIFVLKFRILEKGATPGIMKRELNKLTQKGLEAIGLWWHRAMRPKHFTHAGAREYGYLPRVGERGNPGEKGFRRSYTGQKLRKFGHTNPLEFTGESKTLARIRDVRANSKRVRIVIHANKFNFRNPHSKINMREEMTTVSTREQKQLVRLFDRFLGRLLNNIKRTTQRKVA
ncbi:MAG: hypothetical protein ACE5E6_09395 [Phycisphaerae bacterium]